MRRDVSLLLLAGVLVAEAAQAQLVLPPAPASAPGPAGAEAAADRRYDLLFERPTVATLPRGWTVDFAGPLCVTCPTRWSPGVVNGNAPWQMSGTAMWQGDRDTVAVGLTARRGARLPLYGAPGANSAHVASASEALLSDPRTAWIGTLNLEHVLWRSPRGSTLALFGDLYLPLGTTGGARVTRDMAGTSSRAFIGGTRLRF